MIKIIFISILLGLLFSLLIARFLIPFLMHKNVRQEISVYLKSEHKNKNHTPTMGGLIFILPPVMMIILGLIFKKVTFSYNLIVVLITFLMYGLIGFIDDLLIIKRHSNEGLSESAKMFLEIISAIIFFYFFLKAGNEPLLWIHFLNLKLDIGFLYGFFILIVLVSSSNAVNLTDGLDGLASGLSFIALLTFAIILINTGWLEGYFEIAIFIFILIGSLIGFLFYNLNPAKIFMGDTGSLALGALLGTIAILTRHEFLLILIGIVFVMETVSCLIQRIYYKFTKKRIFFMTPIHHTLEHKMGEVMVVRIFYLIGIIGSILALIYGVLL